MPTEFIFSDSFWFDGFPYAIKEYNDICKIGWTYDIRKEDKMTNKYRVTQEFMNELIKWRDYMNLDAKAEFVDTFVDGQDIQKMPGLVDAWWTDYYDSIENNNRLIAIIKWLNGEDVFEVETPHKFVVRSKEIHSDGYYSYVKVVDKMALHTDYNLAMKFDTREEAQEWANSHQVVVEIDEEGNEVG